MSGMIFLLDRLKRYGVNESQIFMLEKELLSMGENALDEDETNGEFVYEDEEYKLHCEAVYQSCDNNEDDDEYLEDNEFIRVYIYDIEIIKEDGNSEHHKQKNLYID